MNRKPGVWGTVTAVALMAALSAWAAPDLPERVPMHFNLDGEVDRYGGRFEGLVLLPLVTAGLGLLLYVLPLIDPRRRHLEQSAKAYNAVWIGTMAVLFGVHAMVLLAALGRDIPVNVLVTAMIGALFLVIGNYLGKVRSNWFLGVRTPWTLTSERSWDRTHRLAGRLFAGLGVLALLSAFTVPQVAPFIVGAGAAVVAVITVAYSYWIWRTDPARDASEPSATS